MRDAATHRIAKYVYCVDPGGTCKFSRCCCVLLLCNFLSGWKSCLVKT
jgi:hypothetical protein